MSTDSLQGAAAVVVLGSVMIWKALKKQKQTREIEDQPCSKAETASQGLTELQGFAWPKGSIFRKFTGEELVYYSLELQERITEGTGKNRRTKWVTRYFVTLTPEMYLLDPTGLVVIKNSQAEQLFDDPKTRNWRSISATEQSFLLTNVLNVNIPSFPPSNFLFGLFGGTFRIREEEVLIGSPLYAKGDYRSHPEVTGKIKLAGLTKFAQQVFNFQGRSLRDLNPLLDLNKNGNVSREESVFGYARFAKFARSQVKDSTDTTSEQEFEIFGLMQSSDQHKLLIANSHEAHLVERLKRWTLIQLVTGCLLVAGSLTFLLNGGQIKSWNLAKAKTNIGKYRDNGKESP